jgi:hypothetical protein
MRKLEIQLNQLAVRRKTLMTENIKKKAQMQVYKEYHNLMEELVRILQRFTLEFNYF